MYRKIIDTSEVILISDVGIDPFTNEIVCNVKSNTCIDRIYPADLIMEKTTCCNLFDIVKYLFKKIF